MFTRQRQMDREAALQELDKILKDATRLAQYCNLGENFITDLFALRNKLQQKQAKGSLVKPNVESSQEVETQVNRRDAMRMPNLPSTEQQSMPHFRRELSHQSTFNSGAEPNTVKLRISRSNWIFISAFLLTIIGIIIGIIIVLSIGASR